MASPSTPASDTPTPVPASKSAIFMPADQYMHRNAPAEWWWHTGTLTSGDRIFGFEINAASYAFQNIAFSQIMLTDVANAKHYQRTTLYTPPVAVDLDNWAEHDVTRDWHVALGSPSNYLSAIDVTNPGSGYLLPPAVEITGGGGSQAVAYPTMTDGKVTHIQPTNLGRGYTSAPNVAIVGIGAETAAAQAVHSYVTMDAAWGDPTKTMAVVALLVDQATGTDVYFDLMMSQQGPPMLVWGSGVGPILPAASGTHLQTNNYYYSLTRIDTTGSVTIGGEKFAVTGRTWMDHEYGFFGTATHPAKWILQDAQLNNGWTLSNFATLKAEDTPKLNVPMLSFVTLQSPDGTLYFQLSKLTPVGRTWTSPISGNTYFMEFQVEIPSFQATLHVASCIDAQDFSASLGSSIYEGVAAATGSFAGQAVHGTAWNEQAL